MRMRLLSLLSILAVITIMLVMWYPQRYVFGVDLGDSVLQGALFALCTILWALARGGRLRSDPYFECRSNSWELTSTTVRRNIFRIAVELLLLAAVLEIGQAIMARRHGALGDFFVNALVIIALGAIFYVIVARVLQTPQGRQLAQLFTRLD